MQPGDLDREVAIDVTASGHCSIRVRKDAGRLRNGALPIFTTHTSDEAKSLLVRYCVLAKDGSGYMVPTFAGEPEDLYAFGDRLREGYATLLARSERQANAEVERVASKGRAR